MPAEIVDRTKVTLPRLAKEWGVATTKITALIRAGELRAIDIAAPGSPRPRVLIDREDIADFERRRQVVAGGASAPPNTESTGAAR
jgi:hypothetical protein